MASWWEFVPFEFIDLPLTMRLERSADGELQITVLATGFEDGNSRRGARPPAAAK